MNTGNPDSKLLESFNLALLERELLLLEALRLGLIDGGKLRESTRSRKNVAPHRGGSGNDTGLDVLEAGVDDTSNIVVLGHESGRTLGSRLFSRILGPPSDNTLMERLGNLKKRTKLANEQRIR